MRQRLQLVFPILVFALMVQILAPINASWAVAVGASDPLRFAEICHSDSKNPPSQDHQGGPHAHDACVLCCAVQANASFDAPAPVTLAEPYRQIGAVTWRAQGPTWSATRAGSNQQARAPPSLA